jgi:hypothetical protein
MKSSEGTRIFGWRLTPRALVYGYLNCLLKFGPCLFQRKQGEIANLAAKKLCLCFICHDCILDKAGVFQSCAKQAKD